MNKTQAENVTKIKETSGRTLSDINNEYTKLSMVSGDKYFRFKLLEAEIMQCHIEMQKLNEEGMALNKAKDEAIVSAAMEAVDNGEACDNV